VSSQVVSNNRLGAASIVDKSKRKETKTSCGYIYFSCSKILVVLALIFYVLFQYLIMDLDTYM
jgi:hypothetical protein